MTAALLLAGLASCGATGTSSGAATSASVGSGASGGAARTARSLPAFDLPGVRDAAATLRSADLAGRPAVVNLWASWCVPCRKELPALAAAARTYGDRVRFVGIDHQDNRPDAVELLDRSGVTYPSGFDPEGRFAEQLRVRGLPATAFVDRQGRIVHLQLGGLVPAAIDRYVQQLLATP